MEVIAAAVRQGAFIKWNHPGWKRQEPDRTPKFYPVHQELIAKGWLHGIEYSNEHEQYPLVMEMCRDNKLAVMGNSADIHGVISEEFTRSRICRLPMDAASLPRKGHRITERGYVCRTHCCLVW
ncbi:MAG: hypothetical protein U5L72_14230 [Bacteroidales bacterium]|nr:hypothetical protein [Bacteroidales bacterium]